MAQWTDYLSMYTSGFFLSPRLLSRNLGSTYLVVLGYISTVASLMRDHCNHLLSVVINHRSWTSCADVEVSPTAGPIPTDAPVDTECRADSFLPTFTVLEAERRNKRQTLPALGILVLCDWSSMAQFVQSSHHAKSSPSTLTKMLHSTPELREICTWRLIVAPLSLAKMELLRLSGTYLGSYGHGISNVQTLDSCLVDDLLP